ncbi:MAG TPA: hypothetical protein VF021_07460 [Longimicrobiales bacterium]
MLTQSNSVAPGLESFWETCDRDGVGEHPLMRELCFRLDAIQRYRALITDAEESGNDEAVAILTACYDKQSELIRRLRDELGRVPGYGHEAAHK